jgi:RND family efflux transporter MFP subunit
MNIPSEKWRGVGIIRCLLLAAAAGAGCGKQPAAAPPVRTAPHVQVAKVEMRNIVTKVGQPGFIYAYEQTALYPKVSGYLEKWDVDIGDEIHKDQVLATIYVPELQAQHKQTVAQVELDEVMVNVQRQMVEVAENNANVAAAQVTQAEADVGKFVAAVERWESEVKRLTVMSKDKIVDEQILDESKKQLKQNKAAQAAAEANVKAAKATALAKKAEVAKAQVDVKAASGKVKVAQADEQRLAALVSYTKITAPYDGRVVIRNANTGDFLQPSGGDLSATPGNPDQPPMRGTPIYVVARTDKVRVFVDVPEADADYVKNGSKARVRIQAFSGAEIDASVTRTSWSLGIKTRTLRAEIDLPNKDARLLPGMYAYGTVAIERDKVQAVPAGAITVLGNQNCCYLLEDGKAVKTPIQVGISDGKWTEVAGKQVNGEWSAITGSEQVILGDLGEIVDGEPVQVASKKSASAAEQPKK